MFSYLSVLRPGNSPGPAGRDENPTAFFGSLISWLKAACLFAVALSGLALVQGTVTTDWFPIAFMALGLLAGLGLIDRAASYLSNRYPVLSWPIGRSRGSTNEEMTLAAVNGYSNGNGQAAQSSSMTAAELEERVITEDEITNLDDRDREMLRSIIRLDATTVREVMVPRLDMAAVEADSSLEAVAEIMVSRGHSRLPVYEETMDKILGIIHARDVLAALVWSKPKNSLRDLVREAFIVPETKRVDDLLEDLQERRTQIAIVVDEYGGTEGLVTMEDVLEEIVGEIEDEFSRSRDAHVIHQPDGTVLVDAGVTTEHVDEIFGTTIEASEVDTVGGYVYHNLGRIPQAGDTVQSDNLHIEVVSMLGRRLRKLRIRRVDEGTVEANA
ncbi:MAG: hemolysin family protein [Chloroflexi bacterium]|nr:hemolysin family protein [Chloroflexota bacterium]MDA1269800.1 hemolysin family protein [Chloroflexota bacterium]